MQFIVERGEISGALTFVREEARRLGVPVRAARRMELACEEAIVNIFSYAHSGESSRVWLECRMEGCAHFEVLIQDEGSPFNPLEVEVDLQKDVPLSERRIGGLGIFLIRQLVYEAVYLREGGVNLLRLVLRLECEGLGYSQID